MWVTRIYLIYNKGMHNETHQQAEANSGFI